MAKKAVKRIFHISNRVDIPEPGKATAGGLDETIAQAPEGYEVIRFGWSGKVIPDENYVPEEAVSNTTRGNIRYITLDLCNSDYEAFYVSVSNGFLWPLFHFRPDIANKGYESKKLDGYYKVNKLFASIAKKYISESDTVLVHDYHLIPCGEYLREQGIDNPLGFFLHIPAIDSSIMQLLSGDKTRAVTEILGKLFHYDHVGLQSQNDFLNLQSVLGNHIATSAPEHFSTAAFRPNFDSASGTETQFGAFPVAGNTAAYSALAQQWESHEKVEEFIKDYTPGNVHMIGTDRCDYTKGLLAKVDGVGRWLDEYRDDGHLLQIAPLGREDVPAYQEEIIKIRTAFRTLNDTFGNAAYLYEEKVPREIHLALARRSRIGLVTPMRDGMNLYAGEYLAAQDMNNPGVLILSKFAGAAGIYPESILEINPHQPDEIAAAIQRAQEMRLGERQQMLGRALETQGCYTNQSWQEHMIDATNSAAHNRLTS